MRLTSSRVEGAALHLQHLFLDRGHDGRVAVDDEIEHRMQHIVHAVLQQQRRGFQLLAQLAVGPRRAVPHRDDMAATGEDMGLAIGDAGAFEMGGSSYDEELLAIDVDLRQLMRPERVLHRERVEVEPGLERAEFFLRGVGQADPHELGVPQLQALGRLERDAADPRSVAVDMAGHDAH